MLFDRVYEPKEDELIYHYCDANAFHAICSNKTIRLSDIYSMNDFMEVHWGYSIWEEVATKLIKETDPKFIDKIAEILHKSGILGLLLASCFSKKGDVLSQWRAYADDGQGYAIGFKAKDIENLTIRFLEVQYDKKEQIKELEAIIKALYKKEKKTNFSYDELFHTACLNIAYDLVAFKNPAFLEEKEIRIVHLLNFEKSNKSFKLVDKGGNYFGKKIKGEKIQFLMKKNTPTAFIDQNFTNDNKINPIKEVILGPRNQSNLEGVSVFLETIGLENINIKKSNASYR